MALKSKFWKTKKSISEFDPNDQPCHFIASSDYWCGLWPRHKACNIWPKITENGLKNDPKKILQKNKKFYQKNKKTPWAYSWSAHSVRVSCVFINRFALGARSIARQIDSLIGMNTWAVAVPRVETHHISLCRVIFQWSAVNYWKMSILEKMGTAKMEKISFLMIKTCLLSKNSNRNHFLW